MGDEPVGLNSIVLRATLGQATLSPDGKSVAQKANQLDYHRRINAWFDYYLKGEAAPEWITQGVTVLERERELKRSGKDTPTVAKDPGAAN